MDCKWAKWAPGKYIQKIKCWLSKPPLSFYHKNVVVIKKLSTQSDLIECRDCGAKMAINHSVRVILPWESVAHFYRVVNED
jgi:hypothetical protein